MEREIEPDFTNYLFQFISRLDENFRKKLTSNVDKDTSNYCKA